MRELHGNDALRLEQDLHSLYEVIEVRNLGEYVVAEQEVGLLTVGLHLFSGVLAEELDQGGNAFSNGGLSHIGCGFDAEDGDASGDKVLKQVAVVASQLDD